MDVSEYAWQGKNRTLYSSEKQNSYVFRFSCLFIMPASLITIEYTLRFFSFILDNTFMHFFHNT